MVKTFLALFIFVSFALAQTQVETQNGTFITLGTGANQDTAQQASKFLKNADSTTLKAGLLKNADSTTLKAGLLKNADSTTIRNYDNNLYSLKAGSSSIVTVGAVNSGSFGSSFSTIPTTNSKALQLNGTFGVAWAQYSFASDGGSVSTITPPSARNTTIPANAILTGGTVNVTTAVTSSGSATVAIGCAGTGGATTTLLAATAKATLVSNFVTTTVSTFAAPKKLTGAGGITFTIGTAALTAGVIEVFVFYFVAAN